MTMHTLSVLVENKPACSRVSRQCQPGEVSNISFVAVGDRATGRISRDHDVVNPRARRSRLRASTPTRWSRSQASSTSW